MKDFFCQILVQKKNPEPSVIISSPLQLLDAGSGDPTLWLRIA